MRTCISIAVLFLAGCGDDMNEAIDASLVDGMVDSRVEPDAGVDPDAAVDAAADVAVDAAIEGIACGEAKETSRGVEYCETDVAGLRVAFAPLADARPRRLAAYFHGDGAGDWPSIQRYAPWSRERDVLYIAARAPNADDFGPRWWLRPTDESTASLVELLEEFTTAYDLPPDQLLVTGVSGGSQYLTNQFIHRAGDRFQGVFVMNCGGTTPAGPPRWDFGNAALRDRFQLHFNYSTEDFLVPQIEDAFAYFSDAGFEVTRRVVEGTEHCIGIDDFDETTMMWQAAL